MNSLVKIIFDTHEITIDSRNANERRAKPICQYTEDGKLISEFSSISEAEKILGVRHISECVNGLRRSAGGYVWRIQGEYK